MIIAWKCYLVLIFLLCPVTVIAQLTDPYAIMKKYHETINYDRQIAIKTFHSKSVVETALFKQKYHIETWLGASGNYRTNKRVGGLTSSAGMNNDSMWTCDIFGNVHVFAAGENKGIDLFPGVTLTNDSSSNAMDSSDFTYDGIKSINGVDCYRVVKIDKISKYRIVYLIDTSTYLALGTILQNNIIDTYIIISDYRYVDGLPTPFKYTKIDNITGDTVTATISDMEYDISIDSSLFNPPPDAGDNFIFANGKYAENIPIHYRDGHIYLEVMIDGKTYSFLLDTGTGISIIDPKLAEDLGVEITGSIPLTALSSQVHIALGNMPAISLPGLEFNAQTIGVYDFDFASEHGIRYDFSGVFGYNLLSRLITKIDYANEYVSFYHSDSFLYTGDGKNDNMIIMDDYTPYVQMTIDGFHGLWKLDTGSDMSMMSYPYAARCGFLKLKGYLFDYVDLGGVETCYITRLHWLKFAGHIIFNPVLSIHIQDKEIYNQMGNCVGYIGNDLLKYFTVYFDYVHNKMIVERGGHFDSVFQIDRSGLCLEGSPDSTLFVSYVLPKSPADRGGFKEGDTILAINNIDVGYFAGIQGVHAILSQESGKELRFTVLRNGELRRMRLRLKDPFETSRR